ncbi:MAG: TlpA disulfide reductase family protein [Bacteroidota bacterium]
MKLILFLLLFYNWTLFPNRTVNPPKITLIANLKAKEKIYIIFDGDKGILFENYLAIDTIISRDIVTKTPISMRFSLQYFEGIRTNYIFHTFFAAPNDTIYLSKKDKNDIHAVNKLNKSVFIDHWITRKEFMTRPFYPEVTKQGIVAYNSKASITYKNNARIIDSLTKNKTLTSQTKKFWDIANELDYYLVLLQPIKEVNISLVSSTFDTTVEKIMGRFNYLQQVKSDEIYELAGCLYRYNSLRSNKEINSNLNRVSFYINNNSKIGPLTSNMIENILQNIPQKSGSEYKIVKEKVLKYAFANDQELYNKIQNKKPTFSSMSKTIVTDKKGKEIKLIDVIARSKAKYFFFDMWASWCAPCRQQLPAFEKHKKEFEGKNIEFISISIDKNKEAWIEALKVEKIDVQTNQFLLKNYQTSPFKTFFNIATIPRYIILDRTGNVVSDRFYLPTDEEFISEINNILKQ